MTLDDIAPDEDGNSRTASLEEGSDKIDAKEKWDPPHSPGDKTTLSLNWSLGAEKSSSETAVLVARKIADVVLLLLIAIVVAIAITVALVVGASWGWNFLWSAIRG